MRLTERVHLELRKLVHAGDICIDATAGNGHDTLALAELVGPSGRVIAIDIQTQAIEATLKHLEDSGFLEPCELSHGDHAAKLCELETDLENRVRAITFNLGYLPGGDKSITTTAEQTGLALNAAARLIQPGGALFVTAYRAHAGGQAEAGEVENWMALRRSGRWQIEAHDPAQADTERIPPILWIARKLA